MRIRTEAIVRLRDHLALPTVPPGEVPTGSVEGRILRRLEPFAELMYVVIAADAVVGAEERHAVITALEILSDGAVGRDALERLVTQFESDGGVSAEGRIASAAAKIGSERDDRETAFLLTAAVALADDEFEAREERAMTWVRGYLGISERRMSALLGDQS